VLEDASARAVGTFAFDPTFVLGLVGGKEKSTYALTTTTDTIAGVRLTWAPTERTEIKGEYEERFFGKGGTLQMTHRSPFLAISLNASRQPNALGTSFLLNPALGDTRSLLDAVFRTRYPNPADRAVIVNNVIAGLGAPSVLGAPLEVFSDYAQLRDSVILAVAFQGVRSTVITRVFASKSRQLVDKDAPVVPVIGVLADNQQRGMSVDFNRRLSRTLSLESSVGYSTLEGLGTAAGQDTKNTTLRVAATQALSPLTKASAGLRLLRTTVSNPLSPSATADEAAVFVGMTHRF
jgi:uncharacterized protein (PEP-CTERM system associated)